MSNTNPAHQASLHHDFITVWDPEGKFWEGSLVDEQRAVQLRGRGVVLLPCAPAMFRFSGVGGFAKRSWGAGWPIDAMVSKVIAPLTLYCVKDMKSIHWAIRLSCSAEVAKRLREGENLAGSVRFASDRGQQTPFYAGISESEGPTLGEKLPPPDEHDGWTLTGSGTIRVPQEGHYGFGVYGTLPGASVVWVAATTTVR